MNNKKDILLDQVQQILERGLFLAQYSKKYKDLYNKKELHAKKELYKSSNRTMIIVQNVLYAEEAFLLLETLFSEDLREACFHSLLKGQHRSQKYKDFLKIKKEYTDTPLSIFRNKIIAHKDSKNIGDPLTTFFNPIEDIWLDKIVYLYLKLNEYLHKNFDTIVNNVFESWYGKSFDYLYKKLDQDDE